MQMVMIMEIHLLLKEFCSTDCEDADAFLTPADSDSDDFQPVLVIVMIWMRYWTSETIMMDIHLVMECDDNDPSLTGRFRW